MAVGWRGGEGAVAPRGARRAGPRFVSGPASPQPGRGWGGSPRAAGGVLGSGGASWSRCLVISAGGGLSWVSGSAHNAREAVSEQSVIVHAVSNFMLCQVNSGLLALRSIRGVGLGFQKLQLAFRTCQ